MLNKIFTYCDIYAYNTKQFENNIKEVNILLFYLQLLQEFGLYVGISETILRAIITYVNKTKRNNFWILQSGNWSMGFFVSYTIVGFIWENYNIDMVVTLVYYCLLVQLQGCLYLYQKLFKYHICIIN